MSLFGQSRLFAQEKAAGFPSRRFMLQQTPPHSMTVKDAA